jgi:hypothetical protein
VCGGGRWSRRPHCCLQPPGCVYYTLCRGAMCAAQDGVQWGAQAYLQMPRGSCTAWLEISVRQVATIGAQAAADLVRQVQALMW